MYITLIFFSLFSASLLASSNIENLANSPAWKNLLHYQQGFFSDASEVDSPNFFLSPNGSTDPKQELVATIEKIKTDPFVQCNYPARAKLIRDELELPVDFSSCKEYLQFVDEKFPKSVFMVFSSYYMESPASAFGHTFLRISKHSAEISSRGMELLDHGINYGANPTTTNPLLYTILGVVGGFYGTYSSIPYFYKIREYNDYESRDLWSYELNLSEQEKERLVDHLWELRSSYFHYYFFTENCSQKMLGLLDAVNPSWKLLERSSKFVVPADTLKVIAETPHLLGSVSFRPSSKKIFSSSYAMLNLSEKNILDTLINNKDLTILHSMSDIDAARILDVLINYLDYKFANDILREQGEAFLWKQQILSKRSELLVQGISTTVAKDLQELPHLSHGSKRAMIARVNDVNSSYWLFSHRFSLHSFNDPIVGSPATSTIEFFKTDFSLGETTRRLRLDRFTPVFVKTLNPWSAYHRPMSLSATVELSRDHGKICDRCLAPVAKFSVGPSFETHHLNYLSFWLDSSLEYSQSFVKYQLAAYFGTTLSYVYRYKTWLSSETQLSYGYYPLQVMEHWQIKESISFHLKKSWSIGIDYWKRSAEGSVQGNLFYYY